jgi:opacity protein-like surface antigen
MRNLKKLLPVLLLGSALGGCSMAGTGDFFADKHSQAHHTQAPHYWGQSAGCEYTEFTGCEVSYPVAPNYAEAQQYVRPSATSNIQHFGLRGHTYQGQNAAPCHTQQSPVYQQAPVYKQAPAYQPPAYQNNCHQGQHTQGQYRQGQTFQGQHHLGQYQYGDYQHGDYQYGSYPQGHHHSGHTPAYYPSHGGVSKGLRQAYTYGTLGANLYDVDSDLYGLQGRLGWQSKSIFGAEVEGSFGFDKDDAIIDAGTGPIAVEAGIKSQLAGFGVARLPVSERFNILGRVGYHNTEFEIELDDGTTVLEEDFSTDGIAYGVGAEYALSPLTSLRADYTVYDFDGEDADALSLAVKRKF